MDADDDAPSSATGYRIRRAGWGNLLGDNRARRIADGRAAGYLVVRSRTYALPNGDRWRSLEPFEPDSPD